MYPFANYNNTNKQPMNNNYDTSTIQLITLILTIVIIIMMMIIIIVIVVIIILLIIMVICVHTVLVSRVVYRWLSLAPW